MTTKEKFIEMAKNITRPGIDEMMAWLETTDFYDAPASTRFHGSHCTEGERGRRQSRFSFLPAYHGTWYPPHAGGVRRCEQPHGRHEFC